MWLLLLCWISLCILALMLWHCCYVKKFDLYKRYCAQQKIWRNQSSWYSKNVPDRISFTKSSGKYVVDDLESGRSFEEEFQNTNSAEFPPQFEQPRVFSNSPPSERIFLQTETPLNNVHDNDEEMPQKSIRSLFIRLRPEEMATKGAFAAGNEAPSDVPVIFLEQLCSIWRNGNGERELNHLVDTSIFVQPGTSNEGVILMSHQDDFVYMYRELEPDDYEKAFEAREMDEQWQKNIGGIPEEELQKIPFCEFGIVEGIKCPICLAFFRPKQLVSQSECGQLFHRRCILKWLKVRRTCPICRDVVESERWK